MVERMSDAQVFGTCPVDERDLLQSLAVPMRVAAGNEVIGQRDFGASIGVLLEGHASVWRDGEHVADLTPGDVFGELAALAPPSTSGQRTAAIRADTEVRVDTVAAEDINSELSALPHVADALRSLASQRR